MQRNFLLGVCLILGLGLSSFTWAQSPLPELQVVPEGELELPSAQATPPTAEEFSRGEVLEILEERQEEVGPGGTRPYIQTVKVRFTSGSQAGQEAQVQYGALAETQKLTVGQRVIL